MENLINQENIDEIKQFIESKIEDIPAEYLLYGALGTLLLSSFLKKSGHNKTASAIASLSIPIIGIGIKKYSDLLQSEKEAQNEVYQNY